MKKVGTAGAKSLYRLLGPRTVFLVGSLRYDNSDHLCAATNVTCVGTDPTCSILGLWPKWETTKNIIRTGRFTLSLMASAQLRSILIAGEKYSQIAIPNGTNKFDASGLTPATVVDGYPAGVKDSLAIIACKVTRVLTDVSNHVVFIAEAIAGQYDPDAFSDELVLDTSAAQPIMQVSGMEFAEAHPFDSSIEDIREAYDRNLLDLRRRPA